MKRILLFLTFLTLIFSCSSDDSQDRQENEANFYALEVGNKWVYKNYRYNANTELYDDIGVVDSISIVGTEVVNGKTYYKFRRKTTGNDLGITFCNPNGEHFELLRDSLGYLIWDNGRIKFTNNDYDQRELSNQNFATIYETLIQGEEVLSVESGTFNCIYSERYAIDPNGDQLAGKDHFYYSDGIGLIYDTSSFTSNPIHIIERRLDSYFVQ
ncbi:MAG: hypothetical protein GYB39_06645 [Algicola sp.]|nr:hypothetical protein [Algicola sp.]